MARRTEPLWFVCGTKSKTAGGSEYSDERMGGPDNAATKTSGLRDLEQALFRITSGDTGGPVRGKAVRAHFADQKKIKKNIRPIYSLDLTITNGIFETIRRAGFGEGDIHGKRCIRADDCRYGAEDV